MAKMVVMVDMEAVDTARAGVPVAVHMAAMVAVAAVVEAVAVLMAADAAVVMVQLAVTVNRAAIVLATVLKAVMVGAPKLVVTKEVKVVALGELDGAQTLILTVVVTAMPLGVPLVDVAVGQ